MSQEEKSIRPSLEFALYLSILLGFGIILLHVHKGHKISLFGDHGLIHYTITHTLQKVANGDFHQWTNQRIFYPNVKTLAYTDHFYLHSVIGSPYYFLTRDPLNTYVFIFLVQLTIAITGYYFFARQLSGSLTAIILSALYFVYLPAFYDKYPHINFYGFLPWFFFFLMKLFQTGEIKYVHLSALTFLLQAAVSIYFQLFMLILALALVPILAIHFYLRLESRKLLRTEILLHTFLSAGFVLAILILINLPYLEFRRTTGQERSISSLVEGSAGPLSYLVPHVGKDMKLYPFSFLKGVIPEQKRLFLGRTGVYAILASLLLLMLTPFYERKNNRKILLAAVFLLTVFWVLSLGPKLKNTHLDMNLPYYYLYKAHYVFRSIRVPARFEVLMALPIAVLILWWYDEIKMRQIPSFLKIGALIFFGILLWMDVYRPTYPPSYSYVKNDRYIYDRLNQTSGEILLQLPSKKSGLHLKPAANWHDWDDGYYMYTHIFHNKWMVNGESGHYPRRASEIIEAVDRNYANTDELKKLLEKNKISLILIHFDRIDKNYRKNFDTFIKNLEPLTNIILRDQRFLLLSVRE